MNWSSLHYNGLAIDVVAVPIFFILRRAFVLEIKRKASRAQQGSDMAEQEDRGVRLQSF